MSRRVFITLAEASADRHAARLVESLRRLDPQMVIEGHGGEALRDAGATVHRETVSAAAMGWRAVTRTREVWRLLRWTRDRFRQDPPDLHICIDSWSMNIHFAKLARRFNVPVLYYVAPQAWASREGRVKQLRRYVDRLACIWPFEEPFFAERGVPATYVGHPLFDQLPPDRPPRPGYDGRRAPVIGLLAGSRRSVAAQNFPHLLNVARLIAREFPGAQFLVPTTAATDNVVRRSGLSLDICIDRFDEMVPRCDLCLTVSGTAVLHAAAYGVPMIAVYRANPVLWHLVGRWVVRTRTYTMVNWLAGADGHVMPEVIPWYGSPDAVAGIAINLLRSPEKLVEQSRRMAQVLSSIDRPGASMNVAKLALALIGAKGTSPKIFSGAAP